MASHGKRKPIGIIKKGGPGSGHHGHAGIPGKQGGSLPGTGSGSKVVDSNYWKTGPGKNVLNELVYEKGEVRRWLSNGKIKENHVAGLTKITTEVDKLSKLTGAWDDNFYNKEEKITASGLYSRINKSIHLNPQSGVNAGTLHHELGHHVHSKLPQANIQVLKAMHYELQIYIDVKTLDYNKITTTQRKELANFGYRAYSLANFSEFVADTYKIYANGADKPAYRGLLEQANLSNQDSGAKSDWTVDTLFDY